MRIDRKNIYDFNNTFNDVSRVFMTSVLMIFFDIIIKVKFIWRERTQINANYIDWNNKK